MMTHPMSRFCGPKTIQREDVRKILQEFLYTLRSREESNTAKSWNRSRRSSENNRLWTVSMNYLSTLDVV